QPVAQLSESPVRRIEFTTPREVVAGDSVRLSTRALDAQGQPVPNATVSIGLRGGQGEGAVKKAPDATWLIASSVAKFPLILTAVVPGAKPFSDTTVIMYGVPGPAMRISVDPRPSALVAGQTLRLNAVGYSAANDRARDAITWHSSSAAIATVDANG